MNQYLLSYSESIVLSLCKEIEYIKIRSKNINISLKTCHNKTLSKRLRLELEKLNINTRVAWKDQPTRRGISLVDGKGDRAITVFGDRLQPSIKDELPWKEVGIPLNV